MLDNFFVEVKPKIPREVVGIQTNCLILPLSQHFGKIKSSCSRNLLKNPKCTTFCLNNDCESRKGRAQMQWGNCRD